MDKKTSKLPRASATQVKAASAILKQFATTHGGTASDTVLASAVYSLYAALGGPGQPASDYADAVAQATGGETKVRAMIERSGAGFIVRAENPLGLPVGKNYIDADEISVDEEAPKPPVENKEPGQTQGVDTSGESGEDNKTKLASVTELNNMKKADLLEVAAAEKVENFGPHTTNDNIVKAILANRD